MCLIFVGSVHNFVGLTVTIFIEKNCNTTKWPLWPLFTIEDKTTSVAEKHGCMSCAASLCATKMLISGHPYFH